MIRIAIILGLLTPVCSFATGLPLSNHFGVGLSSDSFAVMDPDVESGVAESQYVSGIYTNPVNRNYPAMRLWSQASYKSFEIKPSGDLIGQTVESISLLTNVQYSFNVSRYFRPWVGVGLGIDIGTYTNRSTIDSDGFLASPYEDRSEMSVNSVLNVGLGTKDMGGYHLTVNYFYTRPIGNGITSNAFQFSVLF